MSTKLSTFTFSKNSSTDIFFLPFFDFRAFKKRRPTPRKYIQFDSKLSTFTFSKNSSTDIFFSPFLIFAPSWNVDQCQGNTYNAIRNCPPSLSLKTHQPISFFLLFFDFRAFKKRRPTPRKYIQFDSKLSTFTFSKNSSIDILLLLPLF